MSEWPTKIGLIGCGAMGGAMLRGLARHSGGAGYLVADAIPAAAQSLADELGATVGAIADVAACDLVIVAVKPKDAASVLGEVGGGRGGASVVLSVIAGWDLQRLSDALGGGPVVRTMPNLAVRDGRGLVAMAHQGISEGQVESLTSLLSLLGRVEVLPEAQFAAATALAGSGPGFVALVAEGLEEGAVAAGFARPQARRMVQAVLAGTASLLVDGIDPAELRQRVSSPGGTTVEGVAVLERGAVRAHMADAVRAAARRAQEL